MRATREIKEYDFAIGEFRMTYPIKRDGKKAYPNELDFISDIIQAVKQEGMVGRIEISRDLFRHLCTMPSDYLGLVILVHSSGKWFFQFLPQWKFEFIEHWQPHNLPNEQNPCT